MLSVSGPSGSWGQGQSPNNFLLQLPVWAGRNEYPASGSEQGDHRALSSLAFWKEITLPRRTDGTKARGTSKGDQEIVIIKRNDAKLGEWLCELSVSCRVSSYQPEDRPGSGTVLGDRKHYLPKDWSQWFLQFCKTKMCFYFVSSVEDGPKDYRVVFRFCFWFFFLLGKILTYFVLNTAFSSFPSFLLPHSLIMCSIGGRI